VAILLTCTNNRTITKYCCRNLAMQWIDGMELRTILAQQQRPGAERTVLIGVQLAMALQAVHKAGLLHRDVKPANVLVRDVGGQDHAYLADFGIAKMSEADIDLTGTGWLMGTPGYLSPEQIMGHEPEARSDLYALGCILFEALTGVPPFSGANDQALRWAHATSPRPMASAMYPALGPRYDAFLLQALALDPQDRFRSGSEFAEALQSAHTQRLYTQTESPAAAPTKLEHRPSALPPTVLGTGPAPTVRSYGEPELTVMRPTAPEPVRSARRTAEINRGVPTRIPPSGARPRTSAPIGATPKAGRIDKLIVLAAGILFWHQWRCCPTMSTTVPARELCYRRRAAISRRHCILTISGSRLS
jgi:serine/threonine protein kinase